ncbi:MAG: prolipoprotein diacylglyceryl transferase [Bradymonadia bacterium]
MYPTISHLINDLFGINIPLPIATFGFFLILAIYTGGLILSRELKRKTELGIFGPNQESFVEGKPPSTSEIALASLWSFVVGFKLVEAFLHYGDLVADPQSFILSSRGHFAGGLVFGLFTGFTRFIQGQREALPEPKSVTKNVAPEEHVSNILVIAGLTGILGSKLAHNLEHVDLLIKDPVGQLLGFTGLSFYGGLILATVCTVIYVRKKGMSGIHFMDAVSPAVILAYGVGRIGCQLSGDGDWGIENLAKKPDWLSFAPDWVWGYTYPNNVLSSGIPIEGCTGKYCNVLANPVFPTPLYEVLMAVTIFAILWSIRKRIHRPGVMFSAYLILNGIERYLIEQIRVNPPYTFFGIEATQAELIAMTLTLLGIIGLIVCLKRDQVLDSDYNLST